MLLPDSATNPAAAPRSGLSLIEVLTTSAIVALLAGLLLPALGRARESARSTTCRSNLHQLGLALSTYEHLHRAYPPGQDPYDEKTGGTGAGWAVHVLPEFGEDEFVGDLDLTSDVTFSEAGQVNRLTASKVFDWFVCPSSGRSTVEGRGAISYVGNRGVTHTREADEGMLFDRSRVRSGSVVDGLSYTILLGEVLPGDPDEPGRTPSAWCGWQLAHVAPAGPINDPETGPERFRSSHPGGAYFLFGDTSVRFLADDIDANFRLMRTGGVFGALLTRAGRESMNDRAF